MSTRPRGRVVVVQQPDGWWRWRFEPEEAEASPLVSGEAYPERSEAVESAAEAYPQHRLDVQDPIVARRRWRTVLKRGVVAWVVAVVVVQAARSGNRRGG
jgi:hypothetical protein